MSLRNKLLKKVKNEPKKELSTNGKQVGKNLTRSMLSTKSMTQSEISLSLYREVSDTINNNIDINQVPAVKSPLKSSYKKITIRMMESNPASIQNLFPAPNVVNLDRKIRMEHAQHHDIEDEARIPELVQELSRRQQGAIVSHNKRVEQCLHDYKVLVIHH